LWTALGEASEAMKAWNEVIECGLGSRAARYLARARLKIGARDHAGAGADLREALRDPVTYDEMERAFKVLRRLEGREASALRKCKIALLGNFTTKLIRPLLELVAFRDGVHADIYEAEYGLVHQEVLDKTSGLHSFRPDIVILATSWRDANLPVVSDDPDAAVSRTVERFSQLWRIIKNDLGAHTIQHNFDIPFIDSYGHLSSALPGGRARVMRRVNLALLEAAGPAVSILDFDGLASRFGKAVWADEGSWYRFKQHPSAAALPDLVDEYMMHVRAVLGLNKKVLVLDLDNTVWGGIVGEDGLEGLKVGVVDPEGEAHTDLQRYAKELKERGIVLAVCSKNNEADAREPFTKHPEMVLKLEDIAAFVANWQDKATNLRDIAKALELGLDSFVFLDDNPTERAWVRSQLPQVTVPDIGDDSSYFLARLQHARCFEALTLTDEDRARSADYAAQGQRAELMKSAGTIEEFIRNLQMSADVLAFDDVNLPRVAQLVNKSNQFNLTTRRRTEQQLKLIGSGEDYVAKAFRLRDRFADNGLIGVMIGQILRDDATMEIDTWLMSCRVLGRRVEEFMCGVMMKAAQGRRLRRIRGRYIPTSKNALVKDLYPRLGFNSIGEGPAQGETVWEYDLTSNPIVTNDLILTAAD
jgi:FkbH-like protein